MGRLLRRLLRGLFFGTLAFAALLLVAWLLRKQVLAPLVRPQVEALLADVLAVDRVSIGALDGDWLRAIDAKDIVIEGSSSPLRELRGVRVQGAFSLAALLQGDLSGLRTATVTATLAVLDLRPGPSADEPPVDAGEPFDVAPYRPLLSMFGDGVRVHVDELRLVLPEGERRGAFDFELQRGGGDREFTLSHGAVRVAARVQRAEAGRERVEAVVDVADPGAAMDLFGLGAGVREGSLHAVVGASLSPARLEARIDLQGLRHEGRRLDRSHIVAAWDEESLRVDSATIDLPGVSAVLRELTLPSPTTTAPWSLDALAGRFEVRIDDLEPHAALLPPALLEWMPIRGRLAGTFAAGLLQLDSSDLQARGVELTLQQGSFPLASSNWRDAVGSVQFALVLRQFVGDLPSVGAVDLSGRLDGTLVGSLAEPELELRLDLGSCRTPHGAFASAVGRVRADRAALAVDDLQVRGLELADVGDAAPDRVGLEASCRLGPDGIDVDSLVASIDLGGSLPPHVLAVVFAEHGAETVAASDAPWTLHVEASHGPTGITVTNLRARTDAGAPIEVELTGEGVVPLRWSGTGPIELLGQGDLALRVTATRAADARLPAASLTGDLRVGPASADLRLDVQSPEVMQLRGTIAAERGVAGLFDDELRLGATPLRVALEIGELDLGRLPPAWLGGVELAGRVAGHVRGLGPPGGLAPDVDLRWTDGEVRAAGWPGLGAVQLGLRAAAGEGAAETALRLELTASLEQEFGLEREVAFAADVVTDESGTRLLPTVLRVGGGELALQLTSNLRRSDLLAGAVDGAGTLQGTVAVREFALDKVPPALLGVGSLRGIATGAIELDGTFAALGPATVRRATVSLRGGEIKAGNLPRIEKLAAELTYVPERIELVTVTGTIGAGDFRLHGIVQHEDLLGSFDDARVELRLAGQDLLLFRGDGAKVRASVDLTADGTARDLLVKGKIVLGRGSKYVRRISILPDLNQKGGEAASEGLRLVELPPAIGERLTFEVAITTSEPFEVRTSVFDGEIDVAAGLRGKGIAPRIEGTMSMRSGMLRFPGANLRVTSGLLTFTRSEPLFPDLTVQAEGKRMGFLVSMTVTGRYDAPQVQLSSVPPLPPQDLIVLLSTGQLPSTLIQSGAEGQARFVGGYLAQEVLQTWFGSDSTERGGSLMDRLTIETGREVSKNGTESVLVEYELLPNVSVQVERDAYEDYNLGLVLRFRFR